MLDKIDLLIRNRTEYERIHQVDYRFSMGNNFWKRGEKKKSRLEIISHSIIKNPSPSILKNLRLFCPFFTGMSFTGMRPASSIDKFIFSGQLKFDGPDQIKIEKNIKRALAKARNIDLGYYKELIERFPVPSKYIYQPPVFLGECGIKVPLFEKDLLVNHDIISYQERVSLLHNMNIFDHLMNRLSNKENQTIKILEIGGGYGGLANFIRGVFPTAQYTIIDLPESLLFSSVYLSLNHPNFSHAVMSCDDDQFSDADFRYVPHYASHSLQEPFDLIINTLSMSEMTEFQLLTYLDLMNQYWLSNGGIFFEQNQNNKHLGWINAEEVIQQELELIDSRKALPHRLRQGTANLWKLRRV